MPSTFFKVLGHLCSVDPSFQQACDNITSDCRCETTNPHGLCTQLIDALDRAAAEVSLEPAAEPKLIETVETLVAEHTCIHQPQHHTAHTPTATKLKRAVPIQDFLFYHRHAAPTKQHRAFRNAFTQSHRGTQKPYSSHKLKGAVAKLILYGTRITAQSPAWWTWLEPGQAPTTCAATFAAELALSEEVRERIKEDGGLAEIEIATDAIIKALEPSHHGTFFRPTGLEGFGKETPFRPHKEAITHGRTAPLPDHTNSWPEVVSKPFQYKQLAKDVTITVTFRSIST